MNGSGIYRGTVYHHRDKPKEHRFSYRLPYFLFDLDDLPALDRISRWFGVNRKAWFAWLDRDHGDGSGRCYRSFIERLLAAHDILKIPRTILVMTLPRTAGYAFNPLTVVHCLNADGSVIATVYEVNNTIGERVHYVVREGDQECDKSMTVSPFFQCNGHYEFHAPLPDQRLDLRIVYRDDSGATLRTSFSGRREPITRASIRGVLISYPLVALKVIVAIHFEALRLWLKGLPFLGLRQDATRITKHTSTREVL